MPDSHIPTQYSLDRITLWYDKDGNVHRFDLMINTYNSLGLHIQHEHLTDFVVAPGILTSIKNTINARLLQLETDTGWTQKPVV